MRSQTRYLFLEMDLHSKFFFPFESFYLLVLECTRKTIEALTPVIKIFNINRSVSYRINYDAADDAFARRKMLRDIAMTSEMINYNLGDSSSTYFYDIS